MALLTFFTTIEDAYYYYYQAKATSETNDGRIVKKRHLRTAAFLAWVAVDDAMACWMRDAHLSYPQNCRGARLPPKLGFIFGHLGLSVDQAEFNLHRDVRNSITHPDGGADCAPTLTQVGDMLAYCKRLMKTMYPHLIIREHWLQMLK